MKSKQFWSLLLITTGVLAVILVLGSAGCKSQKKGKPVQETAKWQLVAKGFNFPEGPAWDGHRLYVSNCYGDWIARIENGTVDTFLTARQSPFTFAKTNGLTVDREGNLYACDFGIGAILRFSPQGESHVVSRGYLGRPFHRPNDLAFGPDGNLYFTDPNHYNPDQPDGAVYRISPDGAAVSVADSLAFPNGIAFSPDGRFLYVCESARHRVVRFAWAADRKLESPEIFAELPGGDPDGIAFDRDGNLYVAHFGGGAVYVIAPDGGVLRILPTPGKKPSNLEFGGADLRTLFLTEDETNAVYKMQVEIPGAKLFNSPAMSE